MKNNSYDVILFHTPKTTPLIQHKCYINQHVILTLLVFSILIVARVAHATWHLSSHRSQEQQLLLSSLRFFYKPAGINYHRPQLEACIAHHHHAPPAGPLSGNFLRSSCHHCCTSHNLRAFTKSIRCNSYSMKNTAFLLLGKPPRNPGTNYYARNRLLARNSTSKTQSIHRSISAPHQRCSANSQDLKGTNDSSRASSDQRS